MSINDEESNPENKTGKLLADDEENEEELDENQDEKEKMIIANEKDVDNVKEAAGGDGLHPDTRLTLDEAMNMIGLGWFHVFLLIMCGTGWLFDGLELILISFTIQKQQREWFLTPTLTGLLGSCIYLGMFFGSSIGGVISDRYGRRVIFIGGIFLTTVFGFMSSFASQYWTFFTLRTISGIGLGATVPIDFSLFLEFVVTNKRGTLLAIMNLFFGIGTITCCGMAWLLMGYLEYTWRSLVFAVHFVGFAILVGRIFVPESPRYLYTRGRTKEAMSVLNQLCVFNLKPMIQGELIPHDEFQRVFHPNSKPQQENFDAFEKILQLFSKKYATSTLLLWIIWIMLSYGTLGFSFLVPQVFDRFHTSNPYPWTMLVMGISFVGYLAAVVLMDFFGRKTVLGVTLLTAGLLSMAVGLYNSLWYIVIVGMLLAIVSAVPWTVIYAYTPEIYPTTIRTTGMGACSSLSRISSMVTPLIGQELLSQSFFLPFATFGLSLILGGICSFLLPVETLNKRLSDDVDDDED